MPDSVHQYRTSQRKSPVPGAVGPARERSRDSRMAENSPACAPRRSKSISVPRIERTIFQRNAFAEISKTSFSPSGKKRAPYK